MSAAAEGHEDEGELHQAGWVYFVTYAACLGFLSLLMVAKGLYFASFSILAATFLSIPATVFLGEKKWDHYAGSMFAFVVLFCGGGYALGSMELGTAVTTALGIGVATGLSIPTFQILDEGRWGASLGLALVTAAVVYGISYIPL